MGNCKTPLLSVIIPIYNEERSVQELVEQVQAVSIDKELIMVDDASTDGTADIIRQKLMPRYDNLQYIRHGTNQGKGAAIRTGLPKAKGEILIIQDADLEYRPSDYLRLVKPINEGKTKVVYGSRFMKTDKRLFIWHWFQNRFLNKHYEVRYLHHFVGIQVLNLLANALYNARITDEATCYKVFHREVLKDIKLRSSGFDFCPEFTAKIRKKGYTILEVPITYHPRSKKEGKKLNWKHGFEAIWTLFKYRFTD